MCELLSRFTRRRCDYPSVPLVTRAPTVSAGLSYIPAPKPKLPSHEESYYPPAEYLPTEEERAAAAMAAEADESSEAQPFQPRAYDSLRLVPAYAEFIKERFERCLDLYLCPRTRRRRVEVTSSACFISTSIHRCDENASPCVTWHSNITACDFSCKVCHAPSRGMPVRPAACFVQVDDPQQLLPKLPKPKDLQPFPTQLTLQFLGHDAKVRSFAVTKPHAVPRNAPRLHVLQPCASAAQRHHSFV